MVLLVKQTYLKMLHLWERPTYGKPIILTRKYYRGWCDLTQLVMLEHKVSSVVAILFHKMGTIQNSRGLGLSSRLFFALLVQHIVTQHMQNWRDMGVFLFYWPPIGGMTWSRSFILVRFQIFLIIPLSSSLACSKLPDQWKKHNDETKEIRKCKES